MKASGVQLADLEHGAAQAGRDPWSTVIEIGGRLFPFVLFWIAFLPRAAYPVARSTIWHGRGIRFMEAILEGDWGATFQAPHPGVTTMWLAGIANHLGRLFNPDFSRQPLHEQMSVEIVPLAFITALAIVLAYQLLARIFDRLVATVAALLMALDPFHISVSKTLHVDALMASFITLSALLMLVYISPAGGRRQRYILLSGVLAGLALLSKTPAIFLVPYFLLTLAVGLVSQWLIPDGRLKLTFPDREGWRRSAVILGTVMAVWFLALTVTYWLLWPAMWVQPGETLAASTDNLVSFSQSREFKPLLFMGEITFGDAGPLFYPVNILLKTTAVSLVFFLFGFVLIFFRRITRPQRLALLLCLALVIFFALQMTLGVKKSARYILPAFQFIDIVAAFSAVTLFRFLAGDRYRLIYVLLGLVLAVQFAVSLPRHPYYGTHYNRLFGSPKAILEKGIVPGQDQGEGLDLAAAYLNELPLSPLLVAGTHIEESFTRYFAGKTVPMTDENVDYLVFAHNWIARRNEEGVWGALWQKYRERPPKLIVEFDDVPHVWVYKVGPDIDAASISHPLPANLGPEVQLLGYDLAPAVAQPGETIRLTLYWQAALEPAGDYTVFTHLIDPQGQLRAQHDSQPQAGMYPTYVWSSGERIMDEHELAIDPDAPPGSYEIALGMYTLATLERLPISVTGGQALPNDQLVIPGPEVVAAK